MPGAPVSIEVKGLERLKGKLDGVLDPVGELVEDLVEYVEGETRTGAKPHPGDKGTLGKGENIRTSLAPGAVPLHARVYTKSPIVVTVDQGRSPGKMPSVRRMSDWAERHGIPRSRGFYLARSIGKKGSKPVHFFKKAAEAGEKEAPKLADKAADKMETEWGRP